MAKVINNFTGGRMDSDTHYSLVDNKSFVLAENLRLIGHGDDFSFKKLMGSKMVVDYSENGTMVCVGLHKGSENKMYIFLAHTNGKSKIVQYDVETGDHQLIIQDNTVLRFDLIRWKNGIEIFPYKYLLSFNQIGDLLIFSNEVWENIRCINLKRLSDYTLGFTEEDITLNKKPPKFEPKLFEFIKDSAISDKNKKDTFVSFSYRYKYNDGDWSALSFFSDTAFEMGGYNDEWFKIDQNRLNIGMTNKFNAVKILVNSGDKSVTDVQIVAKEHGSNTAYIIYSANKKKLSIPDNIDSFSHPNFKPIYYKFSKNYKVLSEDVANMLFSNSPKFPKTQDVAGNRLFVANYKEGYDLKDTLGNDVSIDFDLRKDKLPSVKNANNTTAASVFNYSIGVVYYDDYNNSTTVLFNHNETRNDIDIPFADRLGRNIFKAKINSNPPHFATKFKFVVKSQELNYEIVYSHYAKKIAGKVYLLLKGGNVDKVKQGENILFIHQDYTEPKWLYVEEIKSLNKTDDFVAINGLYAIINDVNNEILMTPNQGASGAYRKGELQRITDSMNEIKGRFLDTKKQCTLNYIDGIDSFGNYMQPPSSVFGGTNIPYVTLNNFLNRLACFGNGYGAIKSNDQIKYTIVLHFYKANTNSLQSDEDFKALRFDYERIAEKDYTSIDEFIKDTHDDPRFSMEIQNGKLIVYITDYLYDFLNNNHNELITYKLEQGKRINFWFGLEVNLIRGIDTIWFRTENKDTLNEFYFETPKTYQVINGQHIGAEADRYFDVGFYNAYCWGNGVESYKIKDAFNAKKLNYNFRGNLVDENGYKKVHRKTDITYSGIYNDELGLNQLSWFNPIKSNWKPLPIKYGEIQRIISTDGDISVFFNNKIINQYYGKSVIADMQGYEQLAISNDVLGGYKEIPYAVGISENPESIAVNNNLIYFTDKYHSRFYVKGGDEVQEINPTGSGFHKEGVDLLREHNTFIGGFNEAKGEYVISMNHKKSVVFNMSQKGFTNYLTNKLEYHFGMGGSFFTAYKGMIYENEVTEDYNSFAGQGNFTAKIRYVVNPEIDSDKIYKAMFLQSNAPWDTKIRTNLTATEFSENVYQKRESFYYTEIFRDNSTMLGLVGAGTILDIQGNTLVFKNNVTNQISVGEDLVNESLTYQSEITAITKNTITVADSSGFAIGVFVAGQKKQEGSFRPSGVPIRGKWMEVTLEEYSSNPVYITSVSTEINKSQL